MGELISSIIELSATDKIALLAAILSVASLFFSVIVFRKQQKSNIQNLQAVYFNKIFFDYMLEKIPEAAWKLGFDSVGRLNSNYRELNKVMMQMVRDARYYAYADNAFYLGLKEKTQELEDRLLGILNEVVLDREEQNKILVEIHENIAEIIQYINNKYCN